MRGQPLYRVNYREIDLAKGTGRRHGSARKPLPYSGADGSAGTCATRRQEYNNKALRSPMQNRERNAGRDIRGTNERSAKTLPTYLPHISTASTVALNSVIMNPSLSYDYIEYRYVQQDDGTQKHVAICPECKVVYAATYIEEHIRRQHQERELECSVEGCDFSSLKRNHMIDHTRNVHRDGLHRCNYDGCTHAGGNKSSLANHKNMFHNHIPRQQMQSYRHVGEVDLEEERMVPLNRRYGPIPTSRTLSPTRQASGSRPRSRVGRIVDRINPGTDVGLSDSRGRGTTSPTVTSASASATRFARAGEIPSTTPTPRANDGWFLCSGSATVSISSRSSPPSRRGRGRGRASMADSAPHEIPQLVTPKEFQATFGLIRKPRD